MKELRKAIEASLGATATFMSAELRKNAVDRGWDNDAAMGISVTNDGYKFKANIDNSVSEKVFLSEFGSRDSRPNAVIRNYANRPSGAGSFMLKMVKKNLEGNK
jgi:hypothetical protein